MQCQPRHGQHSRTSRRQLTFNKTLTKTFNKTPTKSTVDFVVSDKVDSRLVTSFGDCLHCRQCVPGLKCVLLFSVT